MLVTLPAVSVTRARSLTFTFGRFLSLLRERRETLTTTVFLPAAGSRLELERATTPAPLDFSDSFFAVRASTTISGTIEQASEQPTLARMPFERTVGRRSFEGTERETVGGVRSPAGAGTA